MRLARTFLLVVLAGCAGDPPVDPALASAAGIYILDQINGTRLPAALDDEAAIRTHVLGEAYSLAVDGTFTRERHYQTVNMETGAMSLGSFTQQGNFALTPGSITFTPVTSDSMAQITATYHGDRITVTVAAQGLTLRYFRSKPD